MYFGGSGWCMMRVFKWFKKKRLFKRWVGSGRGGENGEDVGVDYIVGLYIV